MIEFVLHPRLAADCTTLGDWSLGRLLVLDDARWPWLVLVPRRAGLTELHELRGPHRVRLWHESEMLGAALRMVGHCDRVNIAALGNVVPQLHLHHVARRAGDPGWPGPVWGHGTRQRRDPAARETLSAALRAALAEPLVSAG